MTGGNATPGPVVDAWGDRFVPDPSPLIYRAVAATAEHIGPARRALADWAAAAGVPEPQGEVLSIAVDAAMTLAVSMPAVRTGGVGVSLRAGRTSEGSLVVVATSDTHWWRSSRQAGAQRWSAVALQRCAPDAEVRHTPEGTAIRLYWPAPGPL
jgi:hypothetical protein